MLFLFLWLITLTLPQYFNYIHVYIIYFVLSIVMIFIIGLNFNKHIKGFYLVRFFYRRVDIFRPTKFIMVYLCKKNYLSYFSTILYLLKLRLFSKKTFLKLKWKPLFKKSSYFGLYRSTRNQFLNK